MSRSKPPLLPRALAPALAALALLLAPAAGALPLVAVDLDPGAEGVQPFREVGASQPLEIDLRIFGVEATSPLQGFELDLGFDPALVAVTDVASGGFLRDPVAVLEEELAPPEAGLARVTTGGPTDLFGGDGVLLTLTLAPTGLGDTALDLNDVTLAGPFGAELEGPVVNDAVLRIVPEPGTGALLLAGTAALAAARRRSAAV